MLKPPVCILHAPGTNRDREAAWACELTGGVPDVVHTQALVEGTRRLEDFAMLVIPGGFSFGDDLGAGNVWGHTLRHRLGDAIHAMVDAGKPIIGICNGFQALVRAGILPAIEGGSTPSQASLTFNARGHFECRWVYLEPDPASVCIFTQGLREHIYCPVAHGEGRFVTTGSRVATMRKRGQIALRYTAPQGHDITYPWKPNGSVDHIAGVCNPRGNVLGLMPHPEDHLLPTHHPRFHHGESGGLGSALFAQGIAYARQL